MIDAAWATSLHDRGRSAEEIADQVYRDTGKRVTVRAVFLAIEKYKARSGARPAPAWPWEVLAKHRKDSLYQSLETLYYSELGMGLTDEEKTAVRQLARMLDQYQGVWTYHRKSGFHMVPRRPGDRPDSYFQQRSFDEDGQPIMG